MMGSQHVEVDITPLWVDARKNFLKSLLKPDRRFLTQTDTPESVVKFLGRKKRHPSLKSNRFGRLLERLDLMVEIGDVAMKGAPEIVGLVWAGFRFVFNVSTSGNHHHAL